MPQSAKPGIIVLSTDSDPEFEWLSVGWNTVKKQGTAEAKALKAKADACVEAGENIPDVIARLEAAGFKVSRKLFRKGKPRV